MDSELKMQHSQYVERDELVSVKTVINFIKESHFVINYSASMF